MWKIQPYPWDAIDAFWLPRALHFTAVFVAANWEILLFRRFPLQIFQFQSPPLTETLSSISLERWQIGGGSSGSPVFD